MFPVSAHRMMLWATRLRSLCVEPFGQRSQAFSSASSIAAIARRSKRSTIIVESPPPTRVFVKERLKKFNVEIAGGTKREISMKRVYVAAACVTGFLTIGSSVNAQISSGRYVNECWDDASKAVRHRSGTHATGPSGNNTVGSAGTSSAASGSPGSSASGIPSDRNENANEPPTRPAGLPNC